jgi:hypothetical protein
VVAKDRARSINSASEEAAESLATLKDVSTVAFEQKIAEAHRDKGLTPTASALMEAKKAAKVAQLAAAKACRASNEATFEADASLIYFSAMLTQHLLLS